MYNVFDWNNRYNSYKKFRSQPTLYKIDFELEKYYRGIFWDNLTPSREQILTGSAWIAFRTASLFVHAVATSSSCMLNPDHGNASN